MTLWVILQGSRWSAVSVLRRGLIFDIVTAEDAAEVKCSVVVRWQWMIGERCIVAADEAVGIRLRQWSDCHQRWFRRPVSIFTSRCWVRHRQSNRRTLRTCCTDARLGTEASTDETGEQHSVLLTTICLLWLTLVISGTRTLWMESWQSKI